MATILPTVCCIYFGANLIDVADAARVETLFRHFQPKLPPTNFESVLLRFDRFSPRWLGQLVSRFLKCHLFFGPLVQ